jgi:chromatin remodeling complex protein RSC6
MQAKKVTKKVVSTSNPKPTVTKTAQPKATPASPSPASPSPVSPSVVTPQSPPVTLQPQVTSSEPSVTSTTSVTSVTSTQSSQPSTDEKTHKSFDELVEECVRLSQEQITAHRQLLTCVREAKKARDREMREMQKNRRVKKQSQSSDGEKKPRTGFAKPATISDELADFLCNVAGNKEVHRGMQMVRTDVTKMLDKYFIDHNLRDASDQRIVLYQKDPKLAALLKVPNNEKLTYFNLQTYLKDKFIKTSSETTTNTATTV